jgi:hypothetical protein
MAPPTPPVPTQPLALPAVLHSSEGTLLKLVALLLNPVRRTLLESMGQGAEASLPPAEETTSSERPCGITELRPERALRKMQKRNFRIPKVTDQSCSHSVLHVGGGRS